MRYPELSLYIVSKGRSDKMITLESLPPDVLAITTVVVPEDEMEAYREVCDKYHVGLQAAINCHHVATQRQFCAMQCSTRYFAMADDDLIFSYRNNEGKLRPATPEIVREIFDTIYADLLAGVPAVGISTRFGNNFTKEDYVEIGRMYRIWFLDLDIYHQLGITMAPYPEFFMEDFHWVLTFLEHGYKNRIYYKYAQDDKGGSNAAGGCSTYRTAELQKKAAIWLMTHHASVHLVTKRSKSGWDGLTMRTDVRVEWQKAYNAPRTIRKFSFGKRG